MIDEKFTTCLRCPICGDELKRKDGHLYCSDCGEKFYWKPSQKYIDMRPSGVRERESIYSSEEFQRAKGLMTPGPPFLSGGIKNWVLRSLLSIKPSEKILDAGCGAGRYITWNQDTGAEFTGIDQEPYFASAVEDSAYLVQGFLHYLPFKEETFDSIICMDVLEHMAIGDIERFLASCQKVLRQRGKILIYTNSIEGSVLNPLIKFRRRITEFFVKRGMIDFKVEEISKEDHLNAIKRMDQLAGLASEKSLRLVDRVYYNPVIMGWFENLLLKIMERFLDRRRSRKNLQGGSIALPNARRTGLKDSMSNAKQLMKERSRKHGLIYFMFKFITFLMKFDIFLFSNVKSGQFFLLFEKD